MMNLPHNATSTSQITPYQNVPVQTSQYNFPTCQQQQTNTQQMQTAACGLCSGTFQGPCAHVHQPNTYILAHQCTSAAQPITNPCQAVFQSACNPAQTQPNCTQLPQNILDQIRACISNASPIFILPGNCQQSHTPQQQSSASTSPQGMISTPTTMYPPSGLTYPTGYYPPPFYPYSIPLPFCEPFIRARETMQNCGCCRKRDIDSLEIRNIARAGCHYDIEQDEHRCTPTTDDTVCSKRSCPSSLHLQALASQFLSMQGIISCAATRLVLRKVPGSNVTTSMEDTMTKAQKAISILTKDQLLLESRNAQQVNALINLHMTANPPPNIVPILTLVQLKMNLLKAQVEGLINQRLMECQGVGVEVETALIDPAVLALKSDAELRDFLTILRQKECDERVNVNFAPYRSQRAIAETRLSNIQNKISQVEAEFERRRCAMLPTPISSHIVQQFTAPCYSVTFEDPRRLYNTLSPQTSPDPFAIKPRSPKRLLLKPYVGNPETTTQAVDKVPCNTSTANATDDNINSAKEHPAADQHSSTENCTCDEVISEHYVDKAKKKLQMRIVEIVSTDNVKRLNETFLMQQPLNVCMKIGTEKFQMSKEKYDNGDGMSEERTLCENDAKRWISKWMYINVVDDKSVGTLTKSENWKIDGDNICKLHDVMAMRNFRQINDSVKSESLTKLPQIEEQVEVDIVKLDKIKEIIKKCNIETDNLQNISPSKAKRKEIKAPATTEIVYNDLLCNKHETDQKLFVKRYILSLQIISKSTKEKHESMQKDKNNKFLMLLKNKIIKQKNISISKILANIIFDKNSRDFLKSIIRYN